jgi:hypothetical protein
MFLGFDQLKGRGVFAIQTFIPAKENVSYLTNRHLLLFCHSGLDPESRVFNQFYKLDAGSSPA